MDTPKTQTKPGLQEPDCPDSVGLGLAESSSIDIGLNIFNERNAVVVFIRPSYVETTRWLNNARGLETRTFETEPGALKNKFLESLKGDETYIFKFETPTSGWGYIFDIKYKVELYDSVKGLRI